MSYERRQIPGYEGYYDADTDGNIFSLRAGRKLSSDRRGKTGYRNIVLSVNGKTRQCYVHELILLTFHGPRPTGLQARHLNDIRSDNRSVNLKWGTPKENSADRILNGGQARGSRMGTAKLTETQVLEIRAIGRSAKLYEIAALYGVSFSLIGQILRRAIWNHV